VPETEAETTRFFKSTITIEVLSEFCSVENMDLPDIIYEAKEGDLSMKIISSSAVELTGAQVAAALKAQGSVAGFFLLNDDGTPIEDED
jgi:hypothetical protein